MKEISYSVLEVVKALSDKQVGKERLITAIAGPPASGKTTLAKHLISHYNQQTEEIAALLPLDGFHLDNSLLAKAGLLARKGAPQTFDFWGFQALLSRVKDTKMPICYPTFDRSRDIAVASSAVIKPETNIVIVEGNYLLLDIDPWCGLSHYFDHTVFIETPVDILRERLVKRWLTHGHNADEALARANSNDIPNAVLTVENRLAADQVISNED